MKKLILIKKLKDVQYYIKSTNPFRGLELLEEIIDKLETKKDFQELKK